jgi:hypothetical protein
MYRVVNLPITLSKFSANGLSTNFGAQDLTKTEN